MRKNFFKIFIGSFLVSLLFLTTAPDVFATSHNTATPKSGVESIRARLRGVAQTGADLGQPASLPAFAGRIVRAALVLTGVIFFALMVYAGSLYLTAGGNEEQVKRSRSTLARAAIGFFIVLFAGAITQFIFNRVSRPVAPEGTSQECIDTSLFGGCPEGYSYRLDAPDEYEDAEGANLSGAVCCRRH